MPQSVSPEPRCLQCDRSSVEIPLITLRYQDKEYWICPQHLPILIHKPEQLAAKLPGAANLNFAQHDH
jgi:hypothetical protein